LPRNGTAKGDNFSQAFGASCQALDPPISDDMCIKDELLPWMTS
jgi:hypothetical protein